MSASKAHALFIQQQAELYPEKQPRELQRLSETRWACRYLSLDSVSSTFDAIILTLQLIGDGDLGGMTKQRQQKLLGYTIISAVLNFLSHYLYTHNGCNKIII